MTAAQGATTAADRYLNAVSEQLLRVLFTQRDRIEEAAVLAAGSIRGGGRLHLFGSGHSQLVAVEATSRAGGLHCAHAIVDPALSPIDPARAGLVERVHGYAEAVLACERLERGEVVVVVSNSGINPVPVEVALGCRDRGLRVVAVTSVAHSASVLSRHRGGRRLFEVADVVIDTHSPPGDACVTLPAGQRVGASSTVLGAAVVNAVVSRAAELVAAAGADPGVITSMNLSDGTRPEQLLPD